jgi:hypothetical protein
MTGRNVGFGGLWCPLCGRSSMVVSVDAWSVRCNACGSIMPREYAESPPKGLHSSPVVDGFVSDHELHRARVWRVKSGETKPTGRPRDGKG